MRRGIFIGAFLVLLIEGCGKAPSPVLNKGFSGRGAASEEKYYSDQVYERLKRYAVPSGFYPEGNSGQLELLIMCIERGDVAILEKLLNAVPDFVNVVEGGSRCSPVHWAAFKGNTNILAVLLKHGADIKKKGTNWDISPLHIARDPSTADFLLRHGADLEGREVHGQTPLMWAARRGNLGVAQFLLERGAKLNAKDEQGRTAFALARIWGRTNMVALLMSAGAVSPTVKETETSIYEVTAGVFTVGGPRHPFAERTLIHGEALNPGK